MRSGNKPSTSPCGICHCKKPFCSINHNLHRNTRAGPTLPLFVLGSLLPMAVAEVWMAEAMAGTRPEVEQVQSAHDSDTDTQACIPARPAPLSSRDSTPIAARRIMAFVVPCLQPCTPSAPDNAARMASFFNTECVIFLAWASCTGPGFGPGPRGG